MLFSEKWPKNDPQFLLHLLIHIDVLMLCSKFELILITDYHVIHISIYSLLVHIYGGQDLFVNEYRTLLSDRLLLSLDYDVTREVIPQYY